PVRGLPGPASEFRESWNIGGALKTGGRIARYMAFDAQAPGEGLAAGGIGLTGQALRLRPCQGEENQAGCTHQGCPVG
ncbi:MAG: hypothetical protein D6773_19325, partial [Alphaproteobacteria bacterium]